jgi:ELWxxDGT repeat protein
MLSRLRSSRQHRSSTPLCQTRLWAEQLDARDLPSANFGTNVISSILKDLNLATSSAISFDPNDPFVAYNDHLYFAANDGVHGIELWRTDGTATGTEIVADLNPGFASSLSADPIYPTPMVVANGKLFFVAATESASVQLWQTDGTAMGTQQVTHFGSMPAFANLGARISRMTAGDSQLYFLGDDGVHGMEWWRTDGSNTGTVLLTDFSLDGSPASAAFFGQAVVGDTLIFSVNNDFSGAFKLFRSDPVTSAVVEIVPDAVGFVPGAAPTMVAVGDVVYFVASDVAHGQELWRSDGTAAGTSIVRDINPGPAYGNITGLFNHGGTLYFTADDGEHGQELWKTDGTATGTIMVKDIAPDTGDRPAWPTGSTAMNFATVGDILYFSANDGVHGQELWRSDGTDNGTFMVRDIIAEPSLESLSTFAAPMVATSDSFPVNLAAVGSDLYFLVRGNQLWRSNGTSEGTTRVHSFDMPFGSAVFGLTALGDQLLFSAADGSHGQELWTVVGPETSARLIRDINETTSDAVHWLSSATFGDATFFAASDGVHGFELWKTDGTAAGTMMIKDMHPTFNQTVPWGFGTYQVSDSNPRDFTVVGNWLYFTAEDGTHGQELWRTDGTSAGTTLVADLRPGMATGWFGEFPAWSNISNMLAVGDDLYFTADDGLHGQELWMSDGSEVGTVFIEDINTQLEPVIWPLADSLMGAAGPEGVPSTGMAPAGSNIQSLVQMNGRVYFSANDGVHGQELWMSDGTPDGTLLVADINTTGNGTLFGEAGFDGNPQGLTVIGDTLYFSADDGIHGNELWKSDGTTQGTVLLKDIDTTVVDAGFVEGYPWPLGSNPVNLTAIGPTLYFTASDGTHGAELWKSDGTSDGTTMVADINDTGASNATVLVEANGQLFFTADDGRHGNELWTVDGNGTGASLVRDINPGLIGSMPANLTVIGDRLYFSADDGVHGNELWTSDGTEDGTHLVADLALGIRSSIMGLIGSPRSGPILGIAGKVVVAANDGTHGSELMVVETRQPAAPVGLRANAGGSYVVMEGETLALDGSASIIPDGSRVSYSWDLDGDGQFDDARGAKPTLVGGQLRRLGLHGGTTSHTIRLRIVDDNGISNDAEASVQVNDSPLAMTGSSHSVVEGTNFNRFVASFTDPGGAEELSHYRATIDWGDGMTYDTGTITRSGNYFRVSGEHNYQRAGDYNVVVTVHDDQGFAPGGVTSHVTSAIRVTNAAIYGSRTFFRDEAGRPFEVIVASFRDMNPHSAAADFDVSINWGDGSTSVGRVSANGRGGFDVRGDHVFAEVGSYTVEVTIRDRDGAVSVVRSAAAIRPARLPLAPMPIAPPLLPPKIAGATLDDELNDFAEPEPEPVGMAMLGGRLLGSAFE